MPLREKYTKQSIRKIRESISSEDTIIQIVNHVEDLNKSFALHISRFREFLTLTLPEYSHSVKNNSQLIHDILMKERKELQANIKEEDSMGKEFEQEDQESLMSFCGFLQQMQIEKEIQEKHLERLMNKNLPRVAKVLGSQIGAMILAKAGSLKRLAMIPAGTIQLLGAEKALFRHLKSGSKTPKYGMIYNHQNVLNAPKKEKGKIARKLAGKTAIAAREDYFK